MSTENIYTTIATNELPPILLKGSPMSSSDGGFCSGSSEAGDDLQDYNNSRSPTDASEDSIDMKVSAIRLPSKNKRKSTEPLKLVSSEIDLGPIKKRILYTEKCDVSPSKTVSRAKKDEDTINPFRPWASDERSTQDDDQQNVRLRSTSESDPAANYPRHPGVTTLHRIPSHVQEKPLELVYKQESNQPNHFQINIPVTPSTTATEQIIPCPPVINTTTTKPFVEPCPSTISSGSSSGLQLPQQCRLSQQRNYKNMTRERRKEANARERTRVHTISAAYDTLRKSIPSYSNTQKLSKLSILRISCQYILMLSRVAGMDYSADGSEPTLADCMDNLTKTIQTEGKLRKKKDE